MNATAVTLAMANGHTGSGWSNYVLLTLTACITFKCWSVVEVMVQKIDSQTFFSKFIQQIIITIIIMIKFLHHHRSACIEYVRKKCAQTAQIAAK